MLKYKVKYCFLTWIFSGLFATIIHAQINYPGTPAGNKLDKNKGVAYITVMADESKINKTLSQTITNPLNYKIDIFASPVVTDISLKNKGLWDSLQPDIYICRIGITSPGASSLGLIFDPFVMDKGCKLFVYNPSMTSILGAYTFRNNQDSRIFAITSIEDDSMIIEVQSFCRNNILDSIHLYEVGVGFPSDDAQKSIQDKYYGESAGCNVDINCVLEQNIQRQKNSVCRIVFDNIGRCTGTLVNNTARDGNPLVLTAAHCISTDRGASTAIFYFDYESPYCEGPDGSMKSISGSQLLSTANGLDFTLLQLSRTPPVDYYPLYSGWDASGSTVTYTYTIHHPQGDVKKIAVNTEDVFANYFPPYDYNTHWQVSSYDIGSTEQGSSGSALFDTANRVIGTLTTGEPVCSDPINDLYQMFSHSWDDYPLDENQLKHWLDPQGTGETLLDFYYPVDPLLNHAEIITNIPDDDSLIIPEMQTGWGYYTGYNSLSGYEYAEHFYKNGTKYIYAVALNIARLHYAQSYTRFILKIWSGKEQPVNEIYRQELFLFELTDGNENLIHLDSLIQVNQDFFIGYEIQYTGSADSLALFVSNNTSGENTAFFRVNHDWQPLYDGYAFKNTSIALQAYAFDFVLPGGYPGRPFPIENITLYPVPLDGNILQVLFKEEQTPENEILFHIYDLYGRRLFSGCVQSPEPNIALKVGDLSSGLYVLEIIHSGTVTRKKFLKN